VQSSAFVGAAEGTIHDYEVVTATKIGELQDKVRDLMRSGARPLGGIAMLHEEESGQVRLHIVFAQAMGR